LTAKGAHTVDDDALAAAGDAAPAGVYACRTCGADCTPARYHSLGVKNLALCPACCLDGRFPSRMLSSGLVKLTAAPHAGAGDAWADAELLLLAATGA
jgi:SWI/SNF related-matrix-associated actin-dependent regulator of chromatin subfamily C